MKKGIIFVMLFGVLAVVGGFLLIQLVPYGRDYTNPPVTGEPGWDSPRTRALAEAACFDCHSNQTEWPWYSRIAPVSWLVARDVAEGREKINFSEWNRPQEETEELVEVLEKGEMPPRIFLVTHPEARLSAEQKAELAQGFQRTFGALGEKEDDD